MRTAKSLFAISLLFAATLSALPAQAQSETLLVLSKKDHTVALVDPATLKVKAKAPVGDDPHEVIASSDGKTAWVSNYGGGTQHTLAVIDLVNAKALKPIQLGALAGPHGVEFHDGHLFFTVEGSKAIGRIDPATGTIDWVMGTGQDRTHMLWIAPDGKQIVTSNIASGTMTVFDQGASGKPTDWQASIIPVRQGAEGFDVSPDTREIWTANAGDGSVSVIDREAKKVLTTLEIGAKGANRLKFTPDGRFVVISSLSGADLLVLDAKSRTVVQRVPVGTGAAGIAISPDGSRIFVACTPDNYVAVVDPKTWKVTGHLDAGGNPDGMAWVSAH